MPVIGLAEDDVKISGFIKQGLEESGYTVLAVADGKEALTVFRSAQLDMLILDVMMPVLNGIDVCRLLRTERPHLPILMLTALGSLDDKLAGFGSGADDYLVKPFHFRELLARIEALMRRNPPAAAEDASVLRFDDLTLNTVSKEVFRDGRLINLTAREISLLELFLRNPNRVLSRQFIAENAWDIHFDTGTNVIDVYVNFLRNKIEKGFARKLIHTKINMGYILK